MMIQMAGDSRPRPTAHAILSASTGLLVGIVVYALATTTRVLLDSGVEAGTGAAAWIIGSALVFAGALFWALLVGIPLLLPLVSVVFAAMALRAGRGAVSSKRRAILGAGLWVFLFGALLEGGVGGGTLDSALLGVAVALGVACGVGDLERRLAS